MTAAVAVGVPERVGGRIRVKGSARRDRPGQGITQIAEAAGGDRQVEVHGDVDIVVLVGNGVGVKNDRVDRYYLKEYDSCLRVAYVVSILLPSKRTS